MNPTDDPKHPAASDPKGADMSPTLRRKLEPEYDDDEVEVDPDAKANNLLAIGLLVVILAIGGVLTVSMMRAKQAEESLAQEETTEAAALPDSAGADSSTASADSAGAGSSATATETKPEPAKPEPAKPEPAKPAPAKPAATASKPAGSSTSSSSSAAAATPPAPPKVAHFGIAVATYINEEKARTELARLGAATSLEGSVVTVKEDGGDAFRVVLGDFPSRAAAEKKADELASGATVREARVIALKK